MNKQIEIHGFIVREDDGEISQADYDAFLSRFLGFIEGEEMRIQGVYFLRPGATSITASPATTHVMRMDFK